MSTGFALGMRDPGMIPIAQRIAALRRARVVDVMAALRAESDDSQTVADEVGSLLGVPVVRMHGLLAQEPRFDLLSFAESARRRCAVLCSKVNTPESIVLLVTDPFDTDTMAWARTRFANGDSLNSFEVWLASAETFDAWLAHCEPALSALGSLTVGGDQQGGNLGSTNAEVINLRHIGRDEGPAVTFVNSTLYDALKAGASDIHLEGDAWGLTLKFRLDGVLTIMRRLESPELSAQVVSRIKVMSQLDIAERRVPQDGRLQITYAGRAIDVRVSIMPSIFGEDAVLRILDRQHLAETLSGLTLGKLGFDEYTAEQMRRLCRKPHGMLLVTGPTGSGKTTTLYAAIAETHQSRDKIITIEDPVEYQLSGVLQIPVNEKKGLTFARGLRSILRHDPDKILVGEIRDAETAQIAVQSALTGHLVFTTVHANTVFDVVGRFDQFGIDPYTFSSAINGVLAQRLLRRLCAKCADPTPCEPGTSSLYESQWLAAIESLRAAGRPPRLFRAVGCEDCRGTGYGGRFALGELLPMTPTLQGLVAQRAPQHMVQEEAERGGWRPMQRLALEAALGTV